MTSQLFLRAGANLSPYLRSAAQSAAAQAGQPAPVPAAPVVWDKRNEGNSSACASSAQTQPRMNLVAA